MESSSPQCSLTVVFSTLNLELPQEMSTDKAEEVVRHLNSSAVSEASLAPLYRAQYVDR